MCESPIHAASPAMYFSTWARSARCSIAGTACRRGATALAMRWSSKSVVCLAQAEMVEGGPEQGLEFQLLADQTAKLGCRADLVHMLGELLVCMNQIGAKRIHLSCNLLTRGAQTPTNPFEPDDPLFLSPRCHGALQ